MEPGQSIRKWFNVVHYGVRKEDERIGYDMVRDMRQHRPKLIIAGASAYPRVIDFAKFRKSVMKLVHCFWWIWPISPAWWLQECIKSRSFADLSPPPPIRRCGDQGAV